MSFYPISNSSNPSHNIPSNDKNDEKAIESLNNKMAELSKILQALDDINKQSEETETQLAEKVIRHRAGSD